MTQPKTNRIPAPIYAAAGAGELALEQLRKLPAVVGDLGTRVVADLGGKAVLTGFELRQKATETLRTANRDRRSCASGRQAELDLAKLREAADLDKLREVADLDKLREVTDLDKLRAAATRNAAVVVAGAQAAQERALAAYGALVARGERVVGAGVLEAAETVNADIEATEASAGRRTPPTAGPPTAADAADQRAATAAAADRPRCRPRPTWPRSPRPSRPPSRRRPARPGPPRPPPQAGRRQARRPGGEAAPGHASGPARRRVVRRADGPRTASLSDVSGVVGISLPAWPTPRRSSRSKSAT